MARHINTSQFMSKINQLQREARSATNRAQRELNASFNSLTREINRIESRYNSAVRKNNSQIQHNRQVINHELTRLKSACSTHVSYTSSINAMQSSYGRVLRYYDAGVDITPEQSYVLDLAEQEQANSLIATNRLFSEEQSSEPEQEIQDVAISEKLALVSVDLMNRWKGAVYALNPNNPDAARHFCTSAREIFTNFIELKAPDSAVFAFNPNAERTERGNATRKEKIRYMMYDKALDESVTDFADDDITNILELFHVLSDGTHGEAGRYKFSALVQVKRRVEQGINFLCAISA